MFHVSRFSIACLALTGALFAQAGCAKCDGAACVTCEFHAALRKPMEELGMFLGWGEKVPCCQLAAVVPCKACLTADDLRKWMPDRKRAHIEQVQKVWFDPNDKNKSTITTRSIADVIKNLGGDVITASTSHFFVVTNAPPATLNRSAHKRLLPELTKAAETLPGLLEPQKALVQREHWMILYLLRSEQLYRDYWAMLGVEPPKFIETAPRMEVFMLHGDPAQGAFITFHDGSDRIYGRFERFLCRVDDTSDFPGEELPSDRLGHTLLAHRIAAGLTDRVVRLGASKAPHKTPWFLELGIGHVLEFRTSGKVVFRGSKSEAAGGGSGSRWDAADWAQRMYRLVGKPKQGAASAAPTFAQLAAVDSASATFDHHLAAWSLMSFLLLQPGEGRQKVFDYMKAVRGGASPAAALKNVYDLDGAALTAAWHAWVRDNPKQLLPPAKPLVSSPAEEMLANFETVMGAKKPARVSDDEHVRTRLAAIGNLRWAQPRERAVAHLLALLRSGNDAEALTARETLRSPDLKDALVASMVWPALEEALEKPTDLRCCIHLVRAAASQTDSRTRLLPSLHKGLATPTNPVELLTAVATTLGELGDPSSQAVLEEATRSPNALIRAEAASALARLSTASALRRAQELINDSSWHVRIASIDIFRRIGTAECVPILYTRLPFENGRLAEDINNTLRQITKLEQPFDTGEKWRRWWETGGKESMERAKPAAAPATVAGDGGGDGFPPILSKRFLFLIDVSRSMSQSVFLKPKAGTTTASPTGLVETNKLRFVTEKLIQLIGDPKEIPDDVIFDIAFFAATTTNWKRELVRTTPENRASAAQFLTSESRSQESSTDLQQALAVALKKADENLTLGEYEAALDTIYLITDGTPTAGQFRDPELLRSWFHEANRNHRIKIYVITVGAVDTDIRFLTRLAVDNYGPPPVIVRRE